MTTYLIATYRIIDPAGYEHSRHVLDAPHQTWLNTQKEHPCQQNR